MSEFKFYRETEFKKTEIGDIPRGWEIKRIRDLFEFLRGYSYRSSEIITDNNTGYILLTINNFEKEGGFTQSKGFIYLLKNENLPKNLIIREKSLFVANTDMSKGLIIGAPLLINPNKFKETLTYSMDLTRLIPKNVDISLDYIFYFLKAPRIRAKLKAYAQGTNVLHLNHNLFKNLPIPLPPLSEQKAIAKVLKDFDDLLEVIEEKIKTLQRIKKGLMEVYFTKGVFEHKEFKDTEIGRIPKEWEVRRLGEVCKEIKEIVRVSDISSNEKFIGLEHIESGIIKIKNFGSSDELKSDKLKFYKGNILYGKLRPYLDKCAVASFNGVCSTDIIVLNCVQGVDTYFISYLMHTKRFINYAISTMKGTNHPRTSWKELKNFVIPLPPLSEQKAIAQRLKTIDDQIENLKNQKETLQKIKKKFMDLLLTGKVRVKEK